MLLQDTTSMSRLEALDYAVDYVLTVTQNTPGPTYLEKEYKTYI